MRATYAARDVIANQAAPLRPVLRLTKGGPMIRNFTLIAVGAAALAACNNEPIVANEQPDPMAGELAKAPPVELPPAIVSTKSYRCKDNSVVRIDWLADKTAYVHGEGQAQTHVKPAVPAEGQPASTDLVAEGGFVVKGDAAGTSVSVALPGKGAQSCHV
jgi:hypothetical protein